MEFLLDTNICIYIIKRKPVQVFKRFRELKPGDVAISSITFAELQYGVQKSSMPEKNQQAIEQFLLPLEIVDFNAKASVEYGVIRSDLEKRGIPIGSLDFLIAAHAKSLGLTLVTNNLREFSRIKGLKLVNWAE